MRAMRRWAAAAVLGLVLAAGGAAAQQPCAACAPAEEAAGPKTEPLTLRQGYVLPIARWAQPTNTPHYVGYYVGGGCPCFGTSRTPLEGTWGWDYAGCYFYRRVWLVWCRCRYQGGTGDYATDGPHLHLHED